MPAATTKHALLEVCEAEYEKLRKLIDPLGDDLAVLRDAEGWSIRDVILHRAHWAGLFVHWRMQGEAGMAVQTPAPGYKWNQLKTYNTMVRAQTESRDWEGAKNDLALAHARLMENLCASTQEELYTKGLFPWMNSWTLGRWAEANGASHYRSASKFIRKRLRELSGN